jgi:hypothetical protein
MRSKSSGVRPSSASTASCGVGWWFFSHALGGVHGAGLIVADRFVFQASVGETAGQGIGQRLKQLNAGGELLLGQQVEQRGRRRGRAERAVAGPLGR